MDESVRAVVIGAGQAGLAVSYFLTKAGIGHVVLERGGIGESWRSQRWDSFTLNTPGWANALPGLPLSEEEPDAFAPRDEVVSYLQRYAATFDLPVREHTAVERLVRTGEGTYEVHTAEDSIPADAVVVASGGLSRPRTPTMAQELPGDIVSLSAGSYRNADALPEGAVLVVGAGQSGCQIVEDLIRAGRKVFMSASRVARVPRVYRGKDIFAWLRDLGLLDDRVRELQDPSAQFDAQPQVSGADGGHTVSLQSLARDGATLLGRVTGVDGSRVTLGANLLECIAYADERSRFYKDQIDEWIDAHGVQAEPPAQDPGEPPLPDLNGSDELRDLDLRGAGVGCVIWCTGFDADWSWMEVDVLDERGHPRHRDGAADVPGLYFVGHPWLSKRKSGLLYGVSEDAERIADHLVRELAD